MKEIAAIVHSWEEANAAGHRCALVTVVHVDGSFYRRPGARMLVTDEGSCTGAISGGCLEGDALRKALLAIASNEPRLVTYDTNDEDDASIGVQLGCNGVIQVLFEPIDGSKKWNPMRILKEVIQQKSAAALVTLFNIKDARGPQVGTIGCLIEDRGSIIEDPSNAGTPQNPKLAALASEALALQKSTFTEFAFLSNTESGIQNSESVVCFTQYIASPLHLVIVGAGNDAIPLAAMGDVLGWEVTVVDGRSSHARADRFLPGCSVIVTRPEQALNNISVTSRTAFVLMTHNYHYDLAMFKLLLDTPSPYIGMLGPAKKRERMLAELAAKGMTIDEGMLSRIFGPAGLETGAETSSEIALSIAAEIQAVMHEKSGGHLRDKPDTIHDRNETRIKTMVR